MFLLLVLTHTADHMRCAAKLFHTTNAVWSFNTASTLQFDLIPNLPAIEEPDGVVKYGRPLGLKRIPRTSGNMRSQYDVGQAKQRVVDMFLELLIFGQIFDKHAGLRLECQRNTISAGIF